MKVGYIEDYGLAVKGLMQGCQGVYSGQAFTELAKLVRFAPGAKAGPAARNESLQQADLISGHL